MYANLYFNNKDIGGRVTAPPPPPACQTPVQSFSAGSSISQQVIILPNVCQTSVKAKSIIKKPIMILPSLSQFVFNNNDIGGVTAPHLFFNPNQPTFRPPQGTLINRVPTGGDPKPSEPGRLNTLITRVPTGGDPKPSVPYRRQWRAPNPNKPKPSPLLHLPSDWRAYS